MKHNFADPSITKEEKRAARRKMNLAKQQARTVCELNFSKNLKTGIYKIVTLPNEI